MTIPSAPATTHPPGDAAPPDQPRVIVVMPAYNAARTLEKTYGDLDKDRVYEVILVDDAARTTRWRWRSGWASSASSTCRTGATAATRRRATWKR